ncbi:adenosine receptor A3 [Thomomys bottae]
MVANSTDPSWVRPIYITMEVFIGFFATVGNVLVIWVVKLNPSLQTTTFYFIVSLALADIAVGLLVIPLAIIISLEIEMYFYSCLLAACMLLVFTHASIMSLLAIAIDRYLRVKLNIRYRRVTTQRRIWFALGLCWLVSFLVGLTPLFGWHAERPPSEHQNATTIRCTFPSVMSLDYMVYFSFIVWIFVPLIVMSAIYLDIFYTLQNKLRQNLSGFKETGSFYGREFKTAKSLFLVLFLFALCWLPLSIINCVLYFKGEVPQCVMFLAILLSHANSVMNPIVYAYKIKKFKETYFLILKACRSCQPSDCLDSSMEQISDYVRAMELFILLSLALFSDAMVMDEKVKASFVLDTASATCNYDAQYKDHTKYWCRGYFRDYCTIIAFTPNNTNRVALRDTGNQLIVTVSCLTKEDMGWYWCGIQRDFARDDMDFTELIVNDNTGALANHFWSGKASGQKNRSCRASKVVHKADRSRMSILIICILITGLGIISIISHLTKRRRTQRNRRSKGLTRSPQTNQASSVIPTPL